MDAKRMLVLSPLPEQLVLALIKMKLEETGSSAELVAKTCSGTTPGELRESLAWADVVIGDYTFKIALDANAMKAAAPCLLVQQPSAGYQHIDVEAAAREGICVANVAGANAIGVAEHTIMAALALLKKLLMQHEKTAAGGWAQDEMAAHGVFELHEKTLGIVGMGRIGREVAARAKPFGCSIVYYDVNRLPPGLEAKLDVAFSEMEDLLRASDVVTLHAPLTSGTRNMLDERRMGQMKHGAVIVNVARGGLVDEAALASALAEGRLAGAAVDVFSEEPLSADNPLLEAPNTILTPHTAGATNESRLRIIGVAMNNVAAVLDGRAPEGIVNGTLPSFEEAR